MLADGQNERVRVIQRETLEELTSFGDGGRQPGQFYGVHSIATDSKGNLYTTETYEGKRVQKFVYKGIGSVPRGYQGVLWPGGPTPALSGGHNQFGRGRGFFLGGAGGGTARRAYRRSKANAVTGRIQHRPETWRIRRLHPDQHERGTVAFAKEARAGGDVGLLFDRARELDAGAHRDLLQIGAEAGVALLIAGLAVMAVVDAHDREVGRVHHRDGGERADVHQQLAVARDHEHAPVAARERQAEADHAGGAHGAGEDEGVVAVVGERRDVARCAGKARDDQKILVPADERRQRLAPVEHESRRSGGCQIARGRVPSHVGLLKTAWRRAVSA